MAAQPDTIIRRLPQALLALLDLDLADVVRVLKHLARRCLASRPEGMYEVLEHDAWLELRDAGGRKAIYHKRQRVRFLQDNIIAYQDQAWGDGEVFAAYHCAPGVPVDRYREGHRWRVLISLRETKNRGDVEAFHIERTILDGFTGDVEDFQTEIAHATRRLSLSDVFPRNRFPKEVTHEASLHHQG